MMRNGIVVVLLWLPLTSAFSLADDKIADKLQRVLTLDSAQVGGVTLYYEKPLQPKLDAIKAILSRHLKEEADLHTRMLSFRQRAGEVVDEVNKIVGVSPSDEQKATQVRLVRSLLDNCPRPLATGENATLYIVTAESTKDYLRTGGSLPSFSYDKATDRASYKPVDDSAGDLVFPVEADRAEQQVQACLSAMHAQPAMIIGIALHEVAEAAMISLRLKPADAYYRWFSEGFANVVAIHVLERSVGPDVAAEFSVAYDVAPYKDLEGEINLPYWLGTFHCIKTPLESEDRLSHARYAYSTHEARRWVKAHGIECVAVILDKACVKPHANDSRQLFAAIKAVTGEDVEQRFQKYQSFTNRAEGGPQYLEKYNAAMAKDDYATALPAAFRMRELSGRRDLRCYGTAAFLLFRMGHEAAADRAILDHAEDCRDQGMKDAHLAMHAMFITYATTHGDPKRAIASSDIVLQAQPDYVPALALRIMKLRATGSKEDVQRVARRIIELDTRPKSRWRQSAETVLKGPGPEKAGDDMSGVEGRQP